MDGCLAAERFFDNYDAADIESAYNDAPDGGWLVYFAYSMPTIEKVKLIDMYGSCLVGLAGEFPDMGKAAKQACNDGVFAIKVLKTPITNEDVKAAATALKAVLVRGSQLDKARVTACAKYVRAALPWEVISTYMEVRDDGVWVPRKE
jgi:hypothetical protein